MDDALQMARARLCDVTPLSFDCGRRCGAACCKGGEEDGMLLFPEEERYYRGAAWAEIKMDRLGKRLVCKGLCTRDLRPLACRIFPLVIRLKRQEDGGLKANINMDVRAWPVCPLMASGRKGLKADFMDAVQDAAALLIQEDKHLSFLMMLTRELELYDEMKRSFLGGK